MLKRILVLGEDPALRDALAAGTQPGTEVTGDEGASAAGAVSWPLGAVAVVADPASADSAGALLEAHAAQQEAVLFLLAEAIDAREGFPAGYSRRIAACATRFAEVLDLDVDARAVLEYGTVLRDVGKLRIDNDILLKKGVLDYDEWTLLQHHTVLGADLLEAREVFTELTPVVRHHHENFDGTGYPDGLEGEAIPHLARAVRILDVYCAMTSPRHYREGAATAEEARAHLAAERGKHFDPQLVTAFLDGRAGDAAAEAG